MDMSPKTDQPPVKPPHESGEDPETLLSDPVPLSWDVNHPLSWDVHDSEICSWNRTHPDAHPPHQPPTKALYNPNDPESADRTMIERSIPLSWDPSGEICSWNRERRPQDQSTTMSLKDPEGKAQREMIERSIPLAWDPSQEICSWNREKPPQPGTKSLRELGEGEPVEMIPDSSGSIPLSWDTAHPLSWDPHPKRNLVNQRAVQGKEAVEEEEEM